jgi:hypothetical protein
MIDPNLLAQLEAGYQSSRPQEKPKEQPKKKGNFLTGLLPTVGGALGAVAGSFVAPIAGTAAGGAAGSALGEALRQRITGEKTNLGNIAKEGAFGAVPGAFKAGKAGVTAIKGARQAGKAQDAAKQIASTKPVPKATTTPTGAPATNTSVPPVQATEAVRPSLLSKLSTAATRRGSGIKTDPAVGGIERADEAAKTLQRLQISGSPAQQLRKVNTVMASHGKQVDDILAKNPIQLDGTAVRGQVEKAVSDPLKYAELDLSTPGAQKALTAHLDKFAQAKTAKEVNDYVKVLNKVATRAKAKLDKGGTLTDKEAAALAAKRSGDEVLSQYPEIAPLKKDMATLFERNADITKQSEKTAGIPILGIKSKALAQGGNKISSELGATGTKIANSNANPGVARKTAGALFGQWGTRAIGEPIVNPQESESIPTTQSMADMTSATTMMPTSTDSIDPLNPTSGAGASSSFFGDPAQVEAAYLQAINAGDTETATAIMKGYELFGASAGTAQKPLSAEASKVIATANSGLSSLEQLAAMIEEGGVPKGTTVPGRGLLGGAGQALLGTTGFDAAADNVADAMVRARTGAAATKEELALYRRMLPQAFDPPEEQQRKMQTVRDYFTSIANRTGSAGTDLEQLATAGA